MKGRRAKISLGTIAGPLALLCALVVVAAPPVTTATAQDRAQAAQKMRGKKPPRPLPPRPSYWGAWLGEQLTGEEAPWDMSAVFAFDRKIGKRLSLIHFSGPFASCYGGDCTDYRFPSEAMQRIRNYGAIPFFSWGSQSIPVATDLSEPDYQLADLAGGAHDSYVARFAEEARDWGHPFFLRFNWEMNGNWFPWAEGVNGNNRRGGYVRAWRHVHDIFEAVGADNVTWVWCPYAFSGRALRGLGALYPGDAYVDWTCLDGFNWARNAVNPSPWMSFRQIFNQAYRLVTRRIAPRKPILLAEMASNGPPRAKATWIRNMFRELRLRFRRVRALIWFNKVDRGVQWPLETSGPVLRAFRRGVRGGYRPNIYAGLSGGPVPPPRARR